MFIFLISFFIGLLIIRLNWEFILEFNFFRFNSYSFTIILIFDWVSLIFSRFVFLISSRVIIFRKEYIHGDLNVDRFIYLIALFVLSMVLIIFSPNLIRILVGWDGLGLVSYCLVIYYQNNKSFTAGLITLFTNRVGDVALLIAVAWIINFGSWNFIFYLNFNNLVMNIIVILVVLACITKRAQIPFSAWLPAAIAAPTPVSSLVHSSTLVTAGVYLIIRFCEGFFIYLNFVMLFISTITIFIAGLAANFEFDLKKIIALSTLRQLGIMFRILFLGDYILAFFHLLVHALFKALLFMCAGFFIHNCIDCQDIRFIGRIVKFMPLRISYFNICNFCLCGLPFFSGFYSKDLILELFTLSYLNLFLFFFVFLSIGLTVRYTIRLRIYLIVSRTNALPFKKINECWGIILAGIRVLVVFAVIMGSLLGWIILNPYFVNLPVFLKLLPLIFVIIGFGGGFLVYWSVYCYSSKVLKLNFYIHFTRILWNLFFLSGVGIVKYPLMIREFLFSRFDQGWLELYGTRGTIFLILKGSRFIQSFSKNYYKVYLVLMFIWLLYIYL